MTQLVSLFDYLGRAAGKELGLRVATYSKAIGNTEVDVRYVENKKYKGPVTLYTEAFLTKFFSSPLNEDIIEQDKKEYALKLAKKRARTSSNSDQLPF